MTCGAIILYPRTFPAALFDIALCFPSHVNQSLLFQARVPSSWRWRCGFGADSVSLPGFGQHSKSFHVPQRSQPLHSLTSKSLRLMSSGDRHLLLFSCVSMLYPSSARSRLGDKCVKLALVCRRGYTISTTSIGLSNA